MFVFKGANGRAVQWQLNQAVDWNGDGTPPGPGTPNTDVTLNLDTVDNNGTGTNSDDSPSACRNSSTNSVLTGSEDWTRISIPFRQFGDAADGAIHKVSDEEMTLPEMLQLQEALNTTDLALTISDAPDPVAAGSPLKYTLTVTNNGPNPANDVQVVQSLPAGTSFSSGSTGCSAVGAQVTCQAAAVPAGAARQIDVTVAVAADLVYTNGGPKTITTSATVENLAGPDSNSGNDSDSETTQVIAVADVKITSVAPTAPLDVLIGQPASVPVAVVIENGGPSSPIDTTLTGTASASAGVTVDTGYHLIVADCPRGRHRSDRHPDLRPELLDPGRENHFLQLSHRACERGRHRSESGQQRSRGNVPDRLRRADRDQHPPR